MIIEKISVLRGPNIWSATRFKLIQMRLNIEGLEERPTNLIEGFSERIEALIPSLFNHRCSEGMAGGFFSRIKMGTWMGHVIEHIALEIQNLAGMSTGFGRTRETKTKGTYNVVFSYEEENAGLFAANAAVDIAYSLINNTLYPIEDTIQKLRELRQKYSLGPSTQSMVNEANSRKIPWLRLDNQSLIQFGQGIHQMRIQATITCNTNHIAVGLACDKEKTKSLLSASSIPVAAGGICSLENELLDIIKTIGFPIVIKPLDGNHGKGATINICDIASAKNGFIFVKKFSSKVIVEKYIEGYDFRILVINNKFTAASKRVPAHVIGTGKNTIKELIAIANNDPRRGFGHENVLTKIEIDRDSQDLLSKLNMTLDDVPLFNQVIYLKSTANLSTGGTSVDVSDQIHPENIHLAERISRIIGLDVCGIDIMAFNLTEALTISGGVVLEVNAAPGFRMHLSPTEGLPRNVAAPVIDMLYPPGKPYRIPIIAVTGTNGKTTTTRLIAHIVKNNQIKVGFSTSDGIYIQNHLMEKGDTTGPLSARYILKDPTVELAVLETARGGILRAGLGFNICDIGIITNISEDHLGLNDIHTLEDLAQVKSVVVESVRKNGWAILNADDPYCLKIAENLNCNIAYFAIDENNPIVLELSKKGMIVAVLENGYITIKKGDWKIRIVKAIEVPLTIDGKAKFMIKNVLAATLASYLYGFKIEDIRLSLQTFVPSVSLTPGRMNIFNFQKFKVIIDYAHNQAGYLAIEEFLLATEAKLKIGIIAGVGDRRDEDIIACGKIAARMFDHIIIRQERHLRGRTEQEIIDLLLVGIGSIPRKVTVEVIPKEVEAIKHAISMADEGDYIVALSDVVSNAIEIVQHYLEKEKMNQ